MPEIAFYGIIRKLINVSMPRTLVIWL